MVFSNTDPGYADLRIETHRIFGVPTGITAFVGRTLRGPVNHPVRVSSFGDFVQIFGGLWEGNTLGFAVQDFFRNGGEQAIVVRLFRPRFETMKDRGLALSAARDIAALLEEAANEVDTSVTTAIQRIEKRVSYYQRKIKADSAREAVDRVTRLAVRSGMTVKMLAENARESVGLLAPLSKARMKVGTLLLEAANEGAWGNHLQARIDHDHNDTESSDLFTLTIRDSTSGRIEQFRNISVQQEHDRYVARVLSNESRLVRIQGVLTEERPSAHPTPEEGRRVWGCHTSGTITVVGPDDRACDGLDLEMEDLVGPECRLRKQGIYALEEVDMFNILCIPAPRRTTRLTPEMIMSAADYCEARRAVYLVDPPTDWDSASKASRGIHSIGSKSPNAAFLFPPLRRDGRKEVHYPSGAIAGIMASNDREFGVWCPPVGANAVLYGDTAPGLEIDSETLVELTEQNINCITYRDNLGAILNSYRTLAGSRHPEGCTLAVRRLTLYIEESLRLGLQWALFEPNDISLWSRIRLQVSTFMRALYQKGAFKGDTPDQAYYVKCGRESTSQYQLDHGIVRLLVGFAPTTPGVFIDTSLEQMTANRPVHHI